jgi:hypothetical protein
MEKGGTVSPICVFRKKRDSCLICFQVYVYSIQYFDDIVWFCYVESVTVVGTKPEHTVYLNPLI